ncbi:MAG: DUF3318 domain-containing protein [Cyanobacteriota bacterium]|nr:DUF3318 domain-containing protein [Cyanobacteriota bacterium]
MKQDREVYRLLEIMPASGRMLAKIISQPQQEKVIETPFPTPWNRERPIYINFDLWRRLPKQQRDLVLLHHVCWSCEIKWFKFDLDRFVLAGGLLGGISEITELDLVGILIAGGLTALAASRIWRNNRSVKVELDADEAAVGVATRRGYTEVEAANYLLQAIEAVAKLEKRSSLNFNELIRAQNLKAIAGLSPVGVPEKVRENG